MYAHTLVPIDGSETSTAALQHAITVAKAFQGEITVAIFYSPYLFTGVGPDFAYGQIQYLEAIKTDAHKSIEAARTLAANAGIKVDARVLEAPNTWRGIIELADTIHADLIVMGSHGRSGLDKLVMGSVTQRVLQHTKIPVLVVRG